MIAEEVHKVNGRKIRSTLRPSRTQGAVRDTGRDDDGSCSSDDSSSSVQSPKSSQFMFIEIRKDLRFSIPSNVVFFVGSILYLILSVIDFQYGDYYYGEYYHGDYYDNQMDSITNVDGSTANITSAVVDGMDNESDTGATSDTIKIDSYTMLSIAAASAFILNAIIDFCRCVHYRHTNSKVHSLWHEDIRADVITAILFGIAACIDLWGAIIYGISAYTDTSEKLIARATLVSTQVYLLSAIAAIMGLDWKCKSLVLLLAITGDILFLIGSIIDVVISYLYVIPAAVQSVDPVLLLKLSLVSSTLWLVDSILYLWSDCHCLLLLYRRRRDIEKKMEIESSCEMQHFTHSEHASSDWTVVPTSHSKSDSSRGNVGIEFAFS